MRYLKMTSLLSLLIILAAALVLGACGSNTALVEDPALENPATETPATETPATETPATEEPVTETPVVEDPVVETPVVEDPVVETHEPVQDPPEYDFTLDVLADTYRYGGSADGYSINYYEAEGPYDWYTGTKPFDPELLAVEILVENATGLKAFVCDLAYEQDLIHVFFVDVYEGFHAPPPVNHTADGSLHHMQVVFDTDQQTGVTGDAVLATVYFEMGSEGTFPPHNYVPPQLEDSRAMASFDELTGELTWHYYNTGDFNQDGCVDWDDIFTNAEWFGEQSDDPNSIPAVIAGTGQQVFLAGEAVIGMHFDITVEGYNIYAGAGAAYPDGGTLLGSVLFTDASGDPTLERLSFTYTVTDPQPGDVYWVKPYYGTVEGIASNLTPE